MEHRDGGLWNSIGYVTRVTISMKACFPAFLQGMGEARPYFKPFGHPNQGMTRIAINGTLPEDIGTGFA